MLVFLACQMHTCAVGFRESLTILVALPRYPACLREYAGEYLETLPQVYIVLLKLNVSTHDQRSWIMEHYLFAL